MVRDLDRICRDAYADAVALRAREPLARHLDMPKPPELLSVSLAASARPSRMRAESPAATTGRRDAQPRP
jgi:hypothetical protein